MSAYAGIEENEGATEDHLQGDVALSMLHLWATGDVAWLRAKGFPVIEGIAQFTVASMWRLTGDIK